MTKINEDRIMKLRSELEVANDEITSLAERTIENFEAQMAAANDAKQAAEKALLETQQERDMQREVLEQSDQRVELA